MITRMQQRRGTSLEWQAVADTVILASGEIGVETDTDNYKIGDGQNVWSNLPYFTSDEYNRAVYAKLNADQDFFGTQNFVQQNSDMVPVIARGLQDHSADLQQWIIEDSENNEPIINTVASVSADGVVHASGISVTGDINLVSEDPKEAPTRIRGLPNFYRYGDEAVSKSYVDTSKSGIAVKTPVQVATTANITLSGTQTIDGVSVVAGNRVLVKNQTDQKLNGIYVVASGSWTRSSDMNSTENTKKGSYVLVESGTQGANTSWVLSTEGTGTNNGGIEFDVDPLIFEKFFNPGEVAAGDGLSKTGVTFSVVGVPNKISVTPSGVSISDTYPGQSSITTVGTIASGVWNGQTISVARGGTGATSLTGFVYGNGTGAFTANPLIPGSAISGDIAGRSSNVTGTVSVANGGTGATTAAAARANLDAAQTVHTHTASQITDPASIVAGRFYAGGTTSGAATRIFVQSATPSSATEGDLWFW